MLEKIDSLIYDNRYSKHPFVEQVVAGNVTREGLKNWAIQKYFQVYGQNRGFSAIHSNAPYEDVRQFQMEQLIAEETPIRDGSDMHYNLMKRFAIRMGATEEDFVNTPVGQPVQAHLDHIIQVCQKEHFVYGMLAFYAIESQTPESVIKLADALKKHFGLNEHDLEWFYVHGEADVEHSDSAKELIIKYASEAPHFELKSMMIVEQTLKVWNNLQDYYYSVLTEPEKVLSK